MDIFEKFGLSRQETFNGYSNKFMGLFILSFDLKSSRRKGWKLAPCVDALNKKSDDIVLSETWLSETNIESLPGYKAFNFVRTKNTKGGLSDFRINDFSLQDSSGVNSKH